MHRINIRSLDIIAERSTAATLLAALHESEQALNRHTAAWTAIGQQYLDYIAECINEYDGLFLLAEAEGKPIGFIFGYIETQDESNFEEGDGDDLYVSEGFVEPAYRKQGVYSLLNQAFEQHYSSFKLRRIFRYTLVNNEPMHYWLQKQGYQPIRVVYEKWL